MPHRQLHYSFMVEYIVASVMFCSLAFDYYSLNFYQLYCLYMSLELMTFSNS